MNHFYDKQLRNIIRILEKDYAGQVPGKQDLRYYIQACGQAWKDGCLDGRTFFSYAGQMLASTGDRSLRLIPTAVDFAPCRCGFDVRRCSEGMFVTAVQGEDRLQPGDMILKINSNTPEEHRRTFQRNFLYSGIAEREMWGNVLKGAAHMLVKHADGKTEDLPLRKFDTPRPEVSCRLDELPNGVLCLTVGSLGDGSALEALCEANQERLQHAERLIIDLRSTHDGTPESLLPVVPFILAGEKTMNSLEGEVTTRTLYSVDNCARHLALLEPYAGDPAADEIIADLRANAGKGMVTRTGTMWDDVPEVLRPAGSHVVLLTDTWTEGAAEQLVYWAKREGRARVIGRNTMGTFGRMHTIGVNISDEFTFVYPMAVVETWDCTGTGLAPDVTIPFTPEECCEDILLRSAMSEV